MEKQNIIDRFKKVCKNKSCRLEFQPTRLNQQFCNTNCKSEHNNAIVRELKTAIKETLDQHKLNHKILKELYAKGLKTLEEKDMALLNFNYRKLTGFQDTDGSNVTFEYYNYALKPNGLGSFTIY